MKKKLHRGINPPHVERIILDFPELNGGFECLEDAIFMYLWNVEDGFLNAGAEPLIDYTFQDILSLAKPMILDAFRKQNLLINTGTVVIKE